ncbi:MAG: serine hydrolase domain-containing protein [Pseudomonadota bacterium]
MASSLSAPASGASPDLPWTVSPAKVAHIARQAMAKTGSRGLAIAIIDHGKVRSVQAFGIRNAKAKPLTTDTIMYGASLTKTVFAYYVLQLVDEGKVDLDKPIADVLSRPLPDYGNLDAYGNWGDLAGDERWRRITPRMVLTHSTGFANFAFLEPDQKLRINFEPGTRFAYSGEGIELLQFMLEEGLKLDTGSEMQRRIFGPLGMRSTSLKWRPEFVRNLADGWTKDGKIEPHDERSKVRAAGSMDTSVSDLAKFAAAAARGWGLSPRARAELVRPQLPITTKQQFPTLAPELPVGKRWPGVAAGLGVIVFDGPQGPAFMKGGHNDSTGNTLVCVERGQRCVLILSNDVRSEATFPQLVRSILGETGVPYRWEYGT